MIKVTKGTVGVTINGRNTIRSYEDAPFSLDEETEARFVALGVAEYFTTGQMGPGTEAAPAKNSAESAQEATASATEDAEDDDTLESMSFPELRNFAKQMGLSASGKREDIIARINEANQVTM